MITIDDPMNELANRIREWGRSLGFQQVGITDTNLGEAEEHLAQWLAKGYHGDMDYMAAHGAKRSRPAELVEGTRRIISARMDYLPDRDEDLLSICDDPARAFVSRYALGRDYHKVMRRRLQRLCDRITEHLAEMDSVFRYRVFVDSAPVLEKPLARKAGLGWIGKHTNLINKTAGSWFFLGEIYTDLPLPVDKPADDHCGTCRECLNICPTQAIVAPYVLDAQRCISYLTIELKGSIPEPLRPIMGNRIYGCDDCQAVCPWNRFASATSETDYLPRQGLDTATLLELFQWTEEEFLKDTAGSAIRRIGHSRWLRNIAVALGNGPFSPDVIDSLNTRRNHPDPLVREHVNWALDQLKQNGPGVY